MCIAGILANKMAASIRPIKRKQRSAKFFASYSLRKTQRKSKYKQRLTKDTKAIKRKKELLSEAIKVKNPTLFTKTVFSFLWIYEMKMTSSLFTKMKKKSL